MKHLDHTVDRTGFVWALGSLCQLHKIPFEANLLLQQITPPYNVAGLLNAGQQLGLKIKAQSAAVHDVGILPLPCIALMQPKPSDDRNNYTATSHLAPAANTKIEPTFSDRPESSTITADSKLSTEPEPTFSLVLILRADQDRVLCIGVGEQNPNLMPVADFALRFTGQVILAGIEQKGAVSEDAIGPADESSKTTFGFRWFVPELLKHKSIWRDVLLASLAIQLMALASPLFTQTIIDKVIAHHSMSTLTVIGIALAVFMLFTAVMTWVRQYLVIHTGNRVDAVLGTQVFSHLFKLPTRYFEQRATGVVVARMHAIEDIREFITGAAVTLILDFPFLLIFLGIMFYYSVPLTLISLALLSVIVVLSFIVAPMFRERLNQQFLLGARNQAFLTEYVAGMETVKSLQMEPQLNSKYGHYMADYLQAGFKTKTLGNTYNTIANTLEQGMTLSILCVGAYLVMNRPDFSIGMLVAFQMFAGRLSQPLLRLVGLWQQFQQASISVKRLGDVLNAPTEPYSLIPAREGNGAGKIEIKRLAFRYADNLPFLYKDFNLTLEPGKCLALMGASGTGKSTLAKLLQGFYQPADGQILIDGRDIRYLSANELRSHFGVVPQETILFSGTLYDNLILANPHASFEEVMQACKWAEIHEVIEQLPKGYQTEVGERGVGLSGGQKQRIAIARALLRRPKILLFDEATSNLDLQTAEHFAKTINALKGQVTMLFIAHQIPKGLKLDGVVQIGNPGQGDERHLDIVSSDAETGQGVQR